MACKNCESDGCTWGTVIMPCMVCILNDGDEKPKSVCHCGLCGHFICNDHWKDGPARIEAAGRNILNKIRKKLGYSPLPKKKDSDAAETTT